MLLVPSDLLHDASGLIGEIETAIFPARIETNMYESYPRVSASASRLRFVFSVLVLTMLFYILQAADSFNVSRAGSNLLEYYCIGSI